MIDVHCHLNFHRFENDIDRVIKRAFAKGVTKIINTGTKIDSSWKALELAQKYGNLYAIVGVHPHHADKLEDNWLVELEKLAKHKKVVGVGECGMDFFSYKSNDVVEKKLQQEVFEKQIELSFKNKLPLQIHNRHAGREILEVLEHHKHSLFPTPGMFHCFAGSLDTLQSALKLGFSIGFDGNITYKGLSPGEDTLLSDIIKKTPLDRILTETDSPYLTPEPYRGQRNEPQYVILIGQFIAQVKGVSFEEVDQQTTQNAETLFHL